MAVDASRMGGVEIPPSVVKATRAVLLSGLKGVPLVRFCRDYKALVGEEFPWRKLGFQTLVEMLNVRLPWIVGGGVGRREPRDIWDTGGTPTVCPHSIPMPH